MSVENLDSSDEKRNETSSKASKSPPKPVPPHPPREVGGRKIGLEPTRYGDWEKNGRCIDF